jgi:hypothetical protein
VRLPPFSYMLENKPKRTNIVRFSYLDLEQKKRGAAAPQHFVNLKSNTMKNTVQRYNYFWNYQNFLAEIFKLTKFCLKRLVMSSESRTFAPC